MQKKRSEIEGNSAHKKDGGFVTEKVKKINVVIRE